MDSFNMPVRAQLQVYEPTHIGNRRTGIFAIDPTEPTAFVGFLTLPRLGFGIGLNIDFDEHPQCIATD
jgi:hypothetical protein